jgi:hypothetical protein
MNKLKVTDIVEAITNLGRDKDYQYYAVHTKLQIIDICELEGPIKFRRWKTSESEYESTEGGISTNQLATITSIFSRKPNCPIQFDRLFSGGGNSRSAFETMLVLTPHFIICYPQKSNPLLKYRSV